jgi:hypothetical protein
VPLIPVEAVFTAKEAAASAAMEHLVHGAEKVAHAFEHTSDVVSHLTGLAGLLAGAFSIERLIETTQEHIKAVGQLAAQTGLVAERADGLLETFEQVGVSAEVAGTVLSRMSMTALRMQEAMSGIGGHAMLTRQAFLMMGVDLQKGPEKALLQMAAGAEKGTVNAIKMNRALRLPMDQAVQMMKFLRQGPEKIRETINEVAESQGAITAEDLKNQAEMKRVGTEIKNAWTRISVVIGREITPLITPLMEYVRDHVKEWVAGAQKFGKFLRNHLSEGIVLAKTFGKVLLANYALQKLTAGREGGPLGVLGIAKMGLGFATRGGAVSSAVSMAGAGVTGWLGPLIRGAAVLLRVGSVLGRLSILGAVIGFVVSGARAIYEDFGGVRAYLIDVGDKLMAHFEAFADFIAPVTDMFGDTGAIGSFFKLALPTLLGALGTVVENIMFVIRAMSYFLGDLVTNTLQTLRHPLEALDRAGARVEADIQSRVLDRRIARNMPDLPTVPKEREGRPEMNFYNSHFDISQKFEEGFEPDRILTAFTNDLASLGERRMQSAFSPVFGVR